MEDYAKRQISELSGGQLQRVFIARALAQGAEWIFLDEPFVGIDALSERKIFDILQELKNSGKTILIVHHDLHKVEEYFDEVVLLNKQLIASGPVQEVFTSKNLQLAYGEIIGHLVKEERKMIQSFIDGLMNYQFLQYALVTSMLVGLASGVIGSFIILRGMSLMGDAISHAVLPGVAISYMFGFSYIFGATAFGMLTAAVIGFVTQRSRLKNDTAIGIVFSSFFALGIILISYAQSATDLYHILFGNVLAVRESDLLLTALVSGIVLIFVFSFIKN